MNDRWISMEEAARLLHVSRPKLREMLESGEVPGLVEHFGVARVERGDFEAWLVKHRNGAGK